MSASAKIGHEIHGRSISSQIVDPSPVALPVKFVFGMYLLLLVTINIDSGVVPSALGCIKLSINLSYFNEGLLGALAFVGVAFSSIFAGSLFSMYCAKWILTVSVLMNGFASLSFALSSSAMMLLTSRAFIGVTQAFVIIYGPIYVEIFAPQRRATLWMSLVYVCSPFGIMLGYGSGFLGSKGYDLPDYNPIRWRIPLLVQSCMLCILALFLSATPRRYIARVVVDKSGPLEDRDNDSARCDRLYSAWSQFACLMKYGIFVWTSATMSVLFFVVTGIQFWISSYLKEVIHADVTKTCLAFIAVSATAPTAGVLFGGWLIDWIGGYSGYHQMLKAMRANAVLGVIAVTASIILMFSNCLSHVMVLVFILLFAGGATVPSSTGILVNCVPSDLQPYSSSISQLSFNIFGYALSTLISGLIMQISSSRLWGFRSVLLWSLWGIPFTILGYVSAMRSHTARSVSAPEWHVVDIDPPTSQKDSLAAEASTVPFAVSSNLMKDVAVVLTTTSAPL